MILGAMCCWPLLSNS